MRKHWATLGVTLFAVFVGLLTNQFAQNVPAQSSESEHARRSMAINLLRGINTAEVNYQHKHSIYAPWDVLVKSEEFTGFWMKWLAPNESQLTDIHFGEAPEILPGWSLRLDVTSNNEGYDVMLEDKNDKTCGYAAITDERGVIRQAKAIDCQI
jgi:hypothetical protein